MQIKRCDICNCFITDKSPYISENGEDNRHNNKIDLCEYCYRELLTGYVYPKAKKIAKSENQKREEVDDTLAHSDNEMELWVALQKAPAIYINLLEILFNVNSDDYGVLSERIPVIAKKISDYRLASNNKEEDKK